MTSRVFTSLACTAAILLIVLSSLPVQASAGTPNAARPAPNASSSTWLITTQWLTQQEAIWKPAQNTSMGFALLFKRASYWNIGATYNTLAVDQADLSMLTSASPGCIRIDIDYTPWLSGNSALISTYDSLVNSIYKAGDCLIIADAAASAYYQSPLAWSQFQSAWVSRVQTLAARYHPAFYIVIKEPGWYAPMVSDATTNPQFSSYSSWLTLANQLITTVHQASVGTKIGVSVSGSDMYLAPSFYQPFLSGLGHNRQLNFYGFDLYDQSAFTATQTYLTQYGNSGKGVWIAEAWSGTITYAYDPSRAQLDKQWMLALYYFAQYIHAQAVMPFFTDTFASYGPWTNSTSAIISTYQTQRTPVYHEFQSLATQYGVKVVA